MSKIFGDFIESEDMKEEAAREKTQVLLDYSAAEPKLGSKISLEDLSSVLAEDRPRAFIDHI